MFKIGMILVIGEFLPKRQTGSLGVGGVFQSILQQFQQSPLSERLGFEPQERPKNLSL